MAPLKVLVVDDSATVRVATSIALKQSGFEVRAVGRVTEGYDLAIAWKPDVVLLDVMILRADGSGGGGLQLLRWVKRADPGLPVVMLTGESGARSRKAAESIGASGYLTKGCPMEEIVKMLRKVARSAS